MKRIADVERAKIEYTKQASDVTRQLAFAGIAVIWVLRESTSRPINPDLAVPLAWFAATLLIDVLQYVASSFLWVIFYNYHYDKTQSDDALVDIPGPLNWVGYSCFWAKLLALFIGWGALTDVVIQRWNLFG